MQTGNLGNFAYPFKGLWEAKEFTKNDLVRHKNTIYVATQDTIPSDVPGVGNTWDIWQEGSKAPVQILDADITLVVGQSSEAPTLNAAFKYLTDHYLTRQHDSGVQAKIILPAGWVMKEQLIVRDINAGWITIEGETPNTAITIAPGSFTKMHKDFYAGGTEDFFAFMGLSCVMPNIRQKFSMLTDSTRRITGYLLHASKGMLFPGSSFTNCSWVGVHALNTSHVWAVAESSSEGIDVSGCSYGFVANGKSVIVADFSKATNCLKDAYQSLSGSFLSCNNGNATGAINGGLVAGRNAVIMANYVVAKNCGVGVYCSHGSHVTAAYADVTGYQAGGVSCLRNADVVFDYGNARKAGTDTSTDLQVNTFGMITAYSALGGVSIPVNTDYNASCIFR